LNSELKSADPGAEDSSKEIREGGNNIRDQGSPADLSMSRKNYGKDPSMTSLISQPSKRDVAIHAARLLINNRWIASETGKTFATINPSTGEEIFQVSEADATDVVKAVKAARTAFELGPWRETRASERGRLLHRLADLIEANGDDLASLESLDNGRPYSIAKAVNVAATVACYRYFAG
jgi:aldehyde dehydrogenase (NAD+)